MAGLAEILDENTRLRLEAARKDALIAALEEKARTAEALVAEVAELGSQNELLSAKNASLLDEVERLTKHFEFLDQKRKLRPNATSP